MTLIPIVLVESKPKTPCCLPRSRGSKLPRRLHATRKHPCTCASRVRTNAVSPPEQPAQAETYHCRSESCRCGCVCASFFRIPSCRKYPPRQRPTVKHRALVSGIILLVIALMCTVVHMIRIAIHLHLWLENVHKHKKVVLTPLRGMLPRSRARDWLVAAETPITSRTCQR
jgi:hypothetical protein